MPTTFANTIDNNPIYADRAEKDAAGNSIQTTYATKSEVNTGLASKQDTISDLSTIRSGAAAGATAVQPGDLATVATTGDYDDLSNKPTIPAAQVNSDWNASSGVAEILNKPTIRNVPASTASDADKVLTVDSNGDAVWMSPSYGLFEAIYGQTSYSDIVAAINAHKIVYCRISATGASRMAFLAYIGSSNVEFQYYRSLNSHSASNQTDEVYVYTVSSTGWTTTTRLTGIKYAAGTHMTSSFANNTLTFQSVWPDVDQTYDATSANAQSGVAIAGALATKEDAFDVGTGLEMDTTGATPTLQVEAPVDIVAGPGIAIDNPDGNTLRVSNSNSEVVLWDGNGTAASSCVLSEHPSNFERLILYVGESAYIDCHSCPGSNGNIRIASVSGGSNSWMNFYFIKRTNLTLEVVGDKRLNFGGIDATTASYTVTIGNKSILWKVVGVNRIANN